MRTESNAITEDISLTYYLPDEVEADLFESIYEKKEEPIFNNFGVTSDGLLKEVRIPFKEYGLSEPMITDIDDVRLSIIGPTGVKIKMSMIWKLLKEIVGKDLSKFSMPVFVNEPTTLLQKAAEFMFYSYFFEEAAKQDTSSKRMLNVALFECCA